jgi:tetratricopeptide (TPR) repeat protein
VGATAALLITVGGCERQPPGPIRFPAPMEPAEPARPSVADFAGARACAGCHRAQYDAWRGSTHGRAGGPAGPATLIVRFDGTPIRFRDAIVTPHRTPQGAYVFRVSQAGRPERAFTVNGVVGGGHLVGGGTQGYLTRFPDGTLRLLPFERIRAEGVWFCNTNSRLGRGWLAITGELRLADCGDWPPVRVFGDLERFANCQACHGSRIRARLDPARRAYVTEAASLAVDCESCHGPAARHAASPAVPLPALATLDKNRSVDVCFRCHALKDVVAPGYLPGVNPADHYALRFPLLGDRPLHPDGRVRTFAYQEGHLASDCYLNGSMTCVDCHDPHSQRYRDVWGRPLHGRFDDGQCLACHASKGDSVEAHARHPRQGPGGRCVDCHMPYLQEPEVGSVLRYARSDHTISIPRPAFDASLGIPSACSACHQDRSEVELERTVAEWWGAVKPHPEVVQGLIRAARAPNVPPATTLLTPDTGHRLAQFMGLARVFEQQLAADLPSFSRDTEERLRRLAQDDDVDIAALALASLHLARGNEPRVRAFLRDRLAVLGPIDRALRRRWVLALGFAADRHRAAGDHVPAITIYRKALEVLPADPAVLENLGLAYAGAGDPTSAVVYYERSLAADSARPLAHVNWGVALLRLGDSAGAEAHYRQALALDPHEPLALLNLGNIHLLRNDPGRAADLYRRALDGDGSLALAHFYLGQAYAMLGDRARAVAAVRQGLEFAPNHRIGLELLRRLRGSP